MSRGRAALPARFRREAHFAVDTEEAESGALALSNMTRRRRQCVAVSNGVLDGRSAQRGASIQGVTCYSSTTHRQNIHLLGMIVDTKARQGNQRNHVFSRQTAGDTTTSVVRKPRRSGGSTIHPLSGGAERWCTAGVRALKLAWSPSNNIAALWSGAQWRRISGRKMDRVECERNSRWDRKLKMTARAEARAFSGGSRSGDPL